VFHIEKCSRQLRPDGSLFDWADNGGEDNGFRRQADGIARCFSWVLVCGAFPVLAQRADFREPVTLAGKDGVLEVRLTARQGKATLDTVAKPVENFLLFDYELVRGAASDGKVSGAGLYPAPTLQVFPGERLIVHFDNGLSGLTIRDYYDPAYTAVGKKVPLYPEQMTSSPLNLHVHGLHVSPKGNADNVMLHIPAGMGNTYTYDIPASMPHGAYWYHSHLHGLTSAQVYLGMVGLLSIGRTDGNLPLVTEKNIPIRNMLLQYNYVHNRAGGLAQLNNPYWPQFVSTIVPPKGDELAKGTYRPLLTPVNFAQDKPGEKYTTVWYAGPLSINNNRGSLQYIPSNLQRFTAKGAERDKDLPADPALPDDKRDMQFTVNGQFQPVIRSKAGQTEIWVLANVSDVAYITVQLTETATGRHPRIAVVGQDGNPYPEVHYPPFEKGTRLVIPPASRFAVAVTIPAEGELILEMPPIGEGARTKNIPGVLYTANGTANPSAVLGTLSVLPEYVSYADGFFIFPTQVLIKAVPAQSGGETTPFVEGQALGTYTSFVDLTDAKPDVTRKLLINGGFLNNLVTKDEAKAFIYAFDSGAFPNVALIQPRLGSVEEWQFINHNNDEHPIHVHVNDFQVISYDDPTTGLRTGPDKFGIDNANVPAPSMLADETVIQPGYLSFRTRFDDYAGLYVMHCHRLNHEDNGLMALINVIPAISSYAVAIPGGPGKPTEVRVYDGNGDKLLATVRPFADFGGAVSVAMGDVDGDGVYDLIVGAGRDHAPEIVVYSGKGEFSSERARFLAFAPAFRGGISVGTVQIDGTIMDNIIVAPGAGMVGEVKVFRSPLPTASGTAPELFASFKPYGEQMNGVTLATGFVDFATGRDSIVTAPGAGSIADVKVWAFPLLRPIPGVKTSSSDPHAAHGGAIDQPVNTSTFMPFGKDYRGGVSLATGWLAGSLGGAKRIVVGQLADSGQVKVFTAGSALDGGPSLYLHSPSQHGHGTVFKEMASFRPFGVPGAVRVATTSTTTGAHLLVSGMSAGSETAVLKYDLVRPTPQARTVELRRLGQVYSAKGAQAAILGGD
jgi:FtsP/CotA-like multicopper oxidase with cupredoxin domain